MSNRLDPIHPSRISIALALAGAPFRDDAVALAPSRRGRRVPAGFIVPPAPKVTVPEVVVERGRMKARRKGGGR